MTEQNPFTTLVREYGPDTYKFGDMLCFSPADGNGDQEIRVAVKVAAREWTVSGRGRQHQWSKVLWLVGSGKHLYRLTLTGAQPVKITGHL